VLPYIVFLLPQRNKALSFPAKKIGERAFLPGEACADGFKDIKTPLAD
jgi:hypothetical protein